MYSPNLSKNPIKFALQCSLPFKPLAIAACLAVLVATLNSRLLIYLVQVVTDTAVQFSEGYVKIDVLWFWALLFPTVYMVNELIVRISGFCGMRWITGATAMAFEKLFAYLAEHSADYFSNRFSGALTNKISNAAKGIEQLLAHCLWQFFPLTIGLFADLFLAFSVHRYFFIILLSWCCIYIPLNIFCVSRIYRFSFKHAETTSDLKGKVVDSTSNIETVQLSSAVNYERSFINRHVGIMRSAHLKEWTASEWVLVTNGFLLAFLMFAIMGAGVSLLGSDQISVGSLAMMITLLLALEQRFFFLARQLSDAVGTFGQIDEGLGELLMPHSITSGKNLGDWVPSEGVIDFKNVEFSYKENTVFSNFNLKIAKGEKVGLVGASGAGKSTLVSLLLRQYEVDSGAILIDGKELSSIKLDCLRRAIAVVPQTTTLFHRTIIENIRYGDLSASDDQVMAAAKLAEADEFIQALPNGYQTFVGERGVKLSGGQRQRISIARAILKNAPILVLDEATSALDSESEAAIQRALSKLIKEKTVIAIAHRLSTLRNMDRIVVLSEGEIAESGAPAELVKANGIYARLWNSQISGFIQE